MDGIAQGGSWRGGVRDGVLGAGGRRRRWPAALKAAIVAESFVAGAKVSEVAGRHGMKAGVLSTWRRASKTEAESARIEQTAALISAVPPFVPVTVSTKAWHQADTVSGAGPAVGVIEIVVADASIRVAQGVDATTLSRVLKAVRGRPR